uniref:Uncharacterized protein n=1 Tax=Pavo cristatus TaxID=9049 RepID=A0A8C9FCI5_PAVCR
MLHGECGVIEWYQNVRENLIWQDHVLKNWTERASGELNLQLALDMLLLKEHGVCGMLNLTDRGCCITIRNATTTIAEAGQKMKEITLHIYISNWM